jgi:hypothetical protein
MTLPGYAGGVTPLPGVRSRPRTHPNTRPDWFGQVGRSNRSRLALWSLMSPSASRRFPVTVTQLPVVRCQVCQRTIAHQPGKASEVLTDHYQRAHPEKLGMPAQ